MKRLNFLLEDQLTNDQSMEVDVMRFVAIIGIVFWIIFAMIKSIPFTHDKKESIETKQSIAKPIEVVLEKVPEQEGIREEKQEKIVEKFLKGLHLQFQSMPDLINMIQTGKAKIFCRPINKGFDLVFEGYITNDILKFKGATDIPEKMWELKNGEDRKYFVNKLNQSIQNVHLFGPLQVMVFFSGGHFDSKVEATFSKLNQEKKQGIISIVSNGQITFHEFKSTKELKEKLQE